jgi:membrane protein
MVQFIRDTVTGTSEFFRRGIWEVDLAPMWAPTRFAMRICQFFALMYRSFFTDQVLLRASALTFTTLISIVPLIGFLFAMLKPFGLHRTVLARMLDYLTAQSEEMKRALESMAVNVEQFLDQTDVTALGFFSFLVIVMAIGSLLKASEESFNAIWHVHRSRPFFVRLRDYTFIVIITPMLFFAGFALQRGFSDAGLTPLLIVREAFEGLLTSYDRLYASSSYWLSSLDTLATFGFSTLHLLPLVVLWMLFTLVYMYAPYTRVPVVAGLAGGLVGATLWFVAYSFYIQFQVGMVRYNRIYGAFASLPFSLLWIYFSWVIVLMGAQVSYVINNLDSYRQLRRLDNPSPACRERLAVRLMTIIARCFREGKPISQEALAHMNQVPEPLVDDVLMQMERANLLLRVQANPDSDILYLPSRPNDRITIEEIINAVRNDGDRLILPHDASFDRVDASLDARDRALKAHLEGVTLDAFAREDQQGRLSTNS